MASMAIHVAKPESLTSRKCDTNDLDQVLTGLIDTRDRETTALLVSRAAPGGCGSGQRVPSAGHLRSAGVKGCAPELGAA
jgi:hypothetical protein